MRNSALPGLLCRTDIPPLHFLEPGLPGACARETTHQSAIKVGRFYDHIEGQCGSGNPLASIGDFAAKAAEHAARIAGVITIVEDLHAKEIGLEVMQGAIELVDWYVREADRLKAAELINMFGGKFSIEPVEVVKRLVYTKAIDWAYEKEWRIWSGRGRSKEAIYEDVAFDPEELEAVYFGCQMTAEYRRDFTALIADRYPHAKMVQAQKAKNEFRLIFGPA